MVHGQVLCDGAPQAGAQVLLVDLDAREPLAATVAGSDGSFAFDAAPAHGLVLGKVTADAVGLAAADAGTEPLRLDLADQGPLHPLTVEVEGGDLPDDLELTLVPRALAAVPDEWTVYLWAPVDGVVHGGFATRPIGPGGATLLVQAGRWELAAQKLVAFGAYSPDVEPPTSWITVAARAGGEQLQRGIEGFEVEVAGPTTVRLSVAPATS